MPDVSFSEHFVGRLKRLSEGRQAHIIGRLQWFMALADDPRLRLRPLRCAPGYFLLDSVRWDRIVLRLDAGNVYVAVDCGGHEVIDEWGKLAEHERPI